MRGKSTPDGSRGLYTKTEGTFTIRMAFFGRTKPLGKLCKNLDSNKTLKWLSKPSALLRSLENSFLYFFYNYYNIFFWKNQKGRHYASPNLCNQTRWYLPIWNRTVPYPLSVQTVEPIGYLCESLSIVMRKPTSIVSFILGSGSHRPPLPQAYTYFT